MATQEPNVYAGLAVVIGGLMHARPQFFAKVMGELLFWVGEDKMLFGSDYAIWEPKWQVEGFVDWEMPDDDEYSDYPRLDIDGQEEDPRPQRRQAVRRRGARRSCSCPVPADEPASPDSAVGVRVSLTLPRPRGARDGLRPGARRADHHARLRRLLRRDRRGRRGGAPAAAHAAVRAELRVPDGGRRARRRAPAAGGRAASRRARGPLHGRGDQRRRRARGRLRRSVPGRDRAATSTALRELFQRKALLARQARVCQALLAAGRRARRSWRCASPTCQPRQARRCAGRCGRARLPRDADAPALVAGDGAPTVRGGA